MVEVPAILHKPVLLQEILSAFSPLAKRKDLIYFDGTFGRGGHYRALNKVLNFKGSLATDQDLTAIDYGRKNFPEVALFHANYSDYLEQSASEKNDLFDLALIDLGVSSPQLDVAERGFSFMHDGPLDMRMNQNSKVDAAVIINEWSEIDLIRVFKEFGEVENPVRVVRAIVSDRAGKKFLRTSELAGLIERVDGWRKKGFHPATQYFMALRLVINHELESVDLGLPMLINRMKPGGLIAVIAFHSLEDRRVKTIFRDSKQGFMVNKKVIVPSEEECKNNPRARSAKLRLFQCGEPPLKEDKFLKRRLLRNL